VEVRGNLVRLVNFFTNKKLPAYVNVDRIRRIVSHAEELKRRHEPVLQPTSNSDMPATISVDAITAHVIHNTHGDSLAPLDLSGSADHSTTIVVGECGEGPPGLVSPPVGTDLPWDLSRKSPSLDDEPQTSVQQTSVVQTPNRILRILRVKPQKPYALYKVQVEK